MRLAGRRRRRIHSLLGMSSRDLSSFIAVLGGLWIGGCFSDPLLPPQNTTTMTETGDGDGDPGDGDGDPGDGDGDPGDGDGDGDPACTTEGCDCTAHPDGCDGDLYCSQDGVCTMPTCGDATPEPLEQCDDGNTDDGDGCDNDCTFTEVLSVHASYQSTCVLLEGGHVRCWGRNAEGQLGYGFTDNIGDDETPASVGNIMLPGPVDELSLGDLHTCILMSTMGVRCWGHGSDGRLGYANLDTIGDDEFPAQIPDVMIGGLALEIDAGGAHTCARLANGKLRCWGFGFDGALGYGNNNNIGDNEFPDSAGDVPLDTALLSIETGFFHTCVITADGSVRCWGFSTYGSLGYGNINNIGDDEPASSAGDVALPMGVPVGTKATQLALGHYSTCALYDSGDVLCWGDNSFGGLGQGNTMRIGDDELPSVLQPILLPAAAVQIAAGDSHACALLDSGEVLCWGLNSFGQLGYGNTDNIGDNELLLGVAPVELGGPASQISAGGEHTCALRADTNELYCWGYNANGELGYGNTDNVGDDEQPLDVGPVPLF
jgi:cysteine-rich repeat protein